MKLIRTDKPDMGIPLDVTKKRGIVGAWAFNEQAGGIAHDLSGKGNDGSFVNMGSENWAFGGIEVNKVAGDEYVNITNDVSSWLSYAAGSIVCVFTPAITASSDYLLGHLGSGDSILISTASGEKLTFEHRADFGTAHVITTTNTISVGRESIVIVTWDVAAQENSIELDGIRVLENDAISVPAAFSGTFKIGAGITSLVYHGLIDLVIVYDYALNASERAALRANPWQKWNPILIPFGVAAVGISMPIVMQQMDHFNGGAFL